MTAPLLRLNGIAKSFEAVRALRGVSFTLEAGEVHALLGENGAGKSTLIKTITGALAPDAGTIELDGVALASLTPAEARTRGIACIYQQPALFPELTVAENLALALESPKPWRWLNWGRRQDRARALLARVGGQIDPGRTVRGLSMPEQQLVEIAKAIGAGARILIMDEPTASLTSDESALLIRRCRDLAAGGVAIIYISHRLDEIFAVADRVTVLRDGESLGTRSVKGLDEAEMIRLMVGRDLSAIYPPPLQAPGATRLRIQKLTCAAGGVRDVSLEIRAGEIFGLAGLVGAGRTELARTIFGLTPAESGRIELDGAAAILRSPAEAVREGFAYVPEDRRQHGVVLPLSLAANISLASLAGFWMRADEERKKAREAIDALGIKTAGPDQPAGELSGGNQQKVAVARWLATKPKVLILDEPTQGVDVGAKAELHAIVRRLAAEGMAVLLISSDLPEVLGMSDRIGVMRAGRLVQILQGVEATPAAVMALALGQSERAAA